jgi:hypothetical protein
MLAIAWSSWRRLISRTVVDTLRSQVHALASLDHDHGTSFNAWMPHVLRPSQRPA